MSGESATRLDLGRLLGAVEDAAPVAAADVVGRCLADALGATEVAFLIADYSGQALIRLGHSNGPAGDRETAARVALSDGAHGRVFAGQALEVVDDASGVQVFAPPAWTCLRSWPPRPARTHARPSSTS